MYIVVGLGNPGEEYERTRHNTGRMAVERMAANLSDFKKKAKFVCTETYMNRSGAAVTKLVSSKKAAEKLAVVYDDLDLPLGEMKISYNRGSGGHKGLESIIKALKTREFIRIRIGITRTTPGGKLKKPQGEREVEEFILGEFKKNEMEVLEKVFEKVAEAVKTLVEEGLAPAMNKFN